MAADGGEQSTRNADQHGEQSREPDQLQRAWQPATDLAGDGTAVLQRSAEITGEHVSEVVDVLGENGTIEAELFVQFGNGRRIWCDPALREQRFGGIA